MMDQQKRSYSVISHGEVTGSYQGFPDACRLPNGDILVVFYAGNGHLTIPNEAFPQGGRICSVRSQDEGRTWSEPVIIYDDQYDNRDPHIAALSNGTLVCSFFSLKYKDTSGEKYENIGTQTITSSNNGETWETKSQFVAGRGEWACSAPVREMADGTLILPLYHQSGPEAWGAVSHSYNGGKNWETPVPIGKDSGYFLPAETDVIRLQDGSLYAALRGAQKEHMRFATSPDLGLTWSAVEDIGFIAHAPHLNRLKSGEILLVYRGAHTNLRVSRDEGRTWVGPYIIDLAWGAYPSTVELADGSVLVVYYPDEAGSEIRAVRFRVPGELELLTLDS